MKNNNNNTISVSPECSPGFKNRKALRDHTRVHQPRHTIPDNIELIDKKNMKKQQLCDDDDGSDICEKKFGFLSSLYMRPHPEGERRGVRPPQPELTPIDCKKDRRGPRDTRAVAEALQQQEDEDQKSLEAVQCLMMLKYFDSVESSGLTTNSNSVDNKMGGECEVYQDMNGGFASKKRSKRRRFIADEDYSPHQDYNPLMTKPKIEEKVRFNDAAAWESSVVTKKNKVMHLDSLMVHKENREEVRVPLYKCSTCGKCFSSHQALGGHKSSHFKLKISIIKRRYDQSLSANGFAPLAMAHHLSSVEGDGSSSMAVLGADSNIHQCRIWRKAFPTGRALEAHQMSSPVELAATSQAEAQASSSQVTDEEAGSQTAGSHGRVLEFDLNKPAPVEDGEDGGGGIGGIDTMNM